MAFTHPILVSTSQRALHVTRACPRAVRESIPRACVGSKRGAAESRALDHAVKAGVERQIAEKALAVVQRASYTAIITEFMRWEDAEKLAFTASRAIPYARIAVTGGVDEAERATLACAAEKAYFDEEELVQDVKTSLLRAVVLRGDLRGGKVSQRDVLGTVCGTVKRELVGDVALSEDGSAYVITELSTAELLCGSITKVGGVSVDASIELLSDISPRELSVKEFYSVEKSTRLDAIASAGFKVSRSSMVERIRSGNVSLNQKVVKTPAKTVHSGDRISCRGLGRVELVEVDTTRKGNMRCTLRRYV